MLDGFLRLTPCPVCSGLDLPAELTGAAAAPRCPACGEEFVERPAAGRVVVSVGRAGQRRSVGEPVVSR
ncbi:MAG: hypothetical protein JWL78_1343 [Chloroflexi bacterium]|nr:hypothetical protein [Chloroflexota bacterium]MEA2614982.1 hypothetical protein [Chloroflexota bacterium]